MWGAGQRGAQPGAQCDNPAPRGARPPPSWQGTAASRDVVAWGTKGYKKQPKTSPNSALSHPWLRARALTPLPACSPRAGIHGHRGRPGRDCPSIPCPIGVRTEHRDSRGLLHLSQSRADCTAQHKGTHSWIRGSAPSPGTLAALARLLPTVPSSCHGKPSRGHPAVWQTGALGMWSLHSAPAGGQRSSRGCVAVGPKGQDSPSGLQQPWLHEPLPSEQRPRERSSVSGSALLKCTY